MALPIVHTEYIDSEIELNFSFYHLSFNCLSLFVWITTVYLSWLHRGIIIKRIRERNGLYLSIDFGSRDFQSFGTPKWNGLNFKL